MKKKGITLFLISIGLITTVLIVLGAIFDKEEFEKQQGLTSVYDVAKDGTVAYVSFDDGRPGVYLTDVGKTQNEPVVQLQNNKEIPDLSFSPDGKKLIYIKTPKNKQQEELSSSIHEINIDTGEASELVVENTLITEIEYHPKNEDLIYFFKAGTFENYSPIASKHPHDFDLFSYRISNGEQKQLTNLKKYMMRSLTISENNAYVVMDDDASAESAEESYAVRQRIFQIALDEAEANPISLRFNDEDIYDFTVMPDDEAFIFQAVSDTGEDGIFQYELFFYNHNSNEQKQLTDIKEHVSNPVVGPDGKTVYFMVDKQFGRSEPEYHLYKMDLDGGAPEEVPLWQ